MNPYNVIIKPVMSEKSSDLRDFNQYYSFIVDVKAGKKDIASAVTRMFDVKVDQVQTQIRRGKMKRRGARIYKEANTKRAYVKLAEGQKIKVFEEL